MRNIAGKGLLIAGLLLGSQYALAQMEGVYISDIGDNCTLTISQINIPDPQFGDAYYRIESLSQSTNLVGAYVTLPPVFNRVYITTKWMFGPSSPKIEMVQNNAQGEHLLTVTYTRQ